MFDNVLNFPDYMVKGDRIPVHVVSSIEKCDHFTIISWLKFKMPWNNAEKCLKNIYILLPYLFLNFTTKVYLLITEYEIKKY